MGFPLRHTRLVRFQPRSRRCSRSGSLPDVRPLAASQGQSLGRVAGVRDALHLAHPTLLDDWGIANDGLARSGLGLDDDDLDDLYE